MDLVVAESFHHIYLCVGYAPGIYPRSIGQWDGYLKFMAPASVTGTGNDRRFCLSRLKGPPPQAAMKTFAIRLLIEGYCSFGNIDCLSFLRASAFIIQLSYSSSSISSSWSPFETQIRLIARSKGPGTRSVRLTPIVRTFCLIISV